MDATYNSTFRYANSLTKEFACFVFHEFANALKQIAQRIWKSKAFIIKAMHASNIL